MLWYIGRSRPKSRETRNDMASPLDPLFRPRSVAVIGASSNPDKMGHQIFRNLVNAGFGGEILPVNPKGETIVITSYSIHYTKLYE